MHLQYLRMRSLSRPSSPPCLPLNSLVHVLHTKGCRRSLGDLSPLDHPFPRLTMRPWRPRQKIGNTGRMLQQPSQLPRHSHLSLAQSAPKREQPTSLSSRAHPRHTVPYCPHNTYYSCWSLCSLFLVCMVINRFATCYLCGVQTVVNHLNRKKGQPCWQRPISRHINLLLISKYSAIT